MKSGNQIRKFNGHKSEVNSVIFSPCGDLLASGSEEDDIVGS